ncbi:MAG: glycosyltransferase [Enhydrobacter sp.]|nr:glycosyltransferase [Enhydrobacter sp.]
MSAAKDMVVFGEDWGRHPSSTQHLVRRLAADRGILWVNSIGLRRPRATARDAVRLGQKLLRTPTVAGSQATRPPSLSIVRPMAVSWPGSALAATANRHLLGRQVRRALAVRGMTRPLLWTSLPTAAPLLGMLSERAVVYYCGDDFGSLAGVDHEPVSAMERVLVARADLIVAASERLAEKFPRDRTLLLPHGADIDLFRHPATPAADLPREGATAGFYGSLSDWIDIELMAAVATRLPEWTFVFVGNVETDVTPLAALPNVRLLGRRDHAALPSYVQHWTVSLLPFRDTAQIRACNPLKLREYLAAGTPVVATPFPALHPFRGLIEVARTPASFVSAMRRAAEDWQRNGQRFHAVRHDSWEERAGELDRALETL